MFTGGRIWILTHGHVYTARGEVSEVSEGEGYPYSNLSTGGPRSLVTEPFSRLGGLGLGAPGEPRGPPAAAEGAPGLACASAARWFGSRTGGIRAGWSRGMCSLGAFDSEQINMGCPRKSKHPGSARSIDFRSQE